MELDFNELVVSKDGKTVYVSAEVTNDVGESAVIKSLSIDTSDTFVELLERPSSRAITQEFDSTVATWQYTDESFAGKLIFVWVGIDEGGEELNYHLAALVNWYSIYCMSMGYVKGLSCNGCNPPMEFIDFILKTKGIEYALQVGNYTQAIKLWNNLFTREAENFPSSPCGCN